MQLPDAHAIAAAADVVYQAMAPTPQQVWASLGRVVGAEVWVKHENRAPTGAFKVRGGLVWFDAVLRHGPRPAGVITATRGNHGQSIGFAAQRFGVPATVVVPHGNSRSKNAAMRALGMRLIEAGSDFQAAREYAKALAAQDGLTMVPSFDERLVAGVATYHNEFFRAVPDLQVLYVPIGLGSGIVGAIAARQALGMTAELVGVVSTHAPAYARSFRDRRLTVVPSTTEIADGMACSTPELSALEWIWQSVDRVVEVDDAGVRQAIRILFEQTGERCEGAGAAGLAAALSEKHRISGQRIGLVLSGGNIDDAVFAAAIQG